MDNVMIQVTRGALAENLVRGHSAVIGSQGELIASCGDPHYYTYMRSTAKPVQAISGVICGAIDHFAINDEELAIMCGSHIGDAAHVQVIESILDKIGLSESDFTLGEDWSLAADLRMRRIKDNIPPRKVYNNCSGKHANMLAICKYMGWDYHAYQEQEHPVQQLILRTVAAYSQMPVSDITIGVDGCGVPVFAMPLSHMALAYHHLVHPKQLNHDQRQAAERVTKAMAAYPEMVAGEGHFCTELMRQTKGRIIAKLGADGVYGAADRSNGYSIALKIEDGNGAMLPIAMMRLLIELDLLSAAEAQSLAAFSFAKNYNCQNQQVGETKAIFHLQKGYQ